MVIPVIKVKWELEEAVALFDLYFRFGRCLNVPKDEIKNLSFIYIKRAKRLGLHIDDKFRNEAGLSIQVACVHYVVTNGAEGMSNASKLFYDTYKLYHEEPDKFNLILCDFYKKYADEC